MKVRYVFQHAFIDATIETSKESLIDEFERCLKKQQLMLIGKISINPNHVVYLEWRDEK